MAPCTDRHWAQPLAFASVVRAKPRPFSDHHRRRQDGVADDSRGRVEVHCSSGDDRCPTTRDGRRWAADRMFATG
jgi:hypothetical protein